MAEKAQKQAEEKAKKLAAQNPLPVIGEKKEIKETGEEEKEEEDDGNLFKMPSKTKMPDPKPKPALGMIDSARKTKMSNVDALAD